MYKLNISEQFETLSIDTDINKDVREINNLGIVNSYLRAFSPLHKESVEDALTNRQPENIHAALTAFKNEFLLPPLPQGQEARAPIKAYWPKTWQMWSSFFGFENFVYEFEFEELLNEFWLYVEYLSFNQAVDDWLVATKIPNTSRGFFTPKEKFALKSFHQPGTDFVTHWRILVNSLLSLDDDSDSEWLFDDLTRMKMILSSSTIDTQRLEEWYKSFLREYADEVFRYRTSNVGVEILILEDQGRRVLSRLYSADEPLSLAWAEIMWAIEQNKYAQLCKFCGGVFVITPPYTRKTCSAACAKQQKAENKGGPEALRKFNRDRQREWRKNAKKE